MFKHFLLLCLFPVLAIAQTPKVTPIRCPNDGVQPQTAVDSTGRIHLIYLKGDPAKSDVFYLTSTDDGQTWSAPIRVNSQPASAIAMGTVRGAQIAIGKNNRPHIAWMGSSEAQPKAPNDATPMLYTRLSDAGDAFEPQRNLITSATGLDGGGSIAADSAGNVYVAWHAPTPGQRGELNRAVWLAISKDDGKTFSPESSMLTDSTGACGCCGMRLGIDSASHLFAIYRAVNPQSRDIYFLSSRPKEAQHYQSQKVEVFPTKTCPMSTAAFARGGATTLVAWETAGEVSFAPIDPKTSSLATLIPAPDKGNNRKHPTLAINQNGVILFAWTEGTGWNQGGNLAWQLYDAQLKPQGPIGRQRGLAVWSLGSALAARDGSFIIVY